MIKRLLLIGIGILVMLPLVSAQQGRPDLNDNDKTPQTQPVFLDTVKPTVEHFYHYDMQQRYRESDTLLTNFQQYDPTRQANFFDYYNLGEIGTAHHQLAYEPLNRRGFDIGVHQMDLYWWKEDDIRFFDVSKPYTHTYYSQAGQDELTFLGTFSSKMAKRGNWSMDFRRISHDGTYFHQQSRHTNLSISAWLPTKNKRYTGLFAYWHNVFKQENNGGITADTLANDGLFTVRDAVPVNLSDAESEYREDGYAYSSYYNVVKRRIGKDSSDIVETIPFTIYHRIAYSNYELKYSDGSPAADSSYYGNFQTNNNGIRNFISYQKLKNTVKFRLNFKGFLEAGIEHSYYNLNQEPQDTVLNNLFLVGDWDLELDKNQRYGLNVKAHLGLLDNGADYLINGNLYLDFGKIGQLAVSAVNQGYNPNLLQHRLYVSQDKVWENNFVKTIESNLSATYRYASYFEATARYHLINNLIYYDTLATPQQISTPVNIGQLMLQGNINFGSFYLENSVLLQQVSDNILRLPTLASKHSLYFQGFIFKKAMFAKIGIDARYNTGFLMDRYQPLVGQFYQQNDQTITNPIIFDVFFNFKVRTFRAFVKAENINNFITNTVYFASPFYPMRDGTIRFGVSWRFYDTMNPASERTNSQNFGGNSPSLGGLPF